MKKIILSTFVILSFVAYAVKDKFKNLASDDTTLPIVPNQNGLSTGSISMRPSPVPSTNPVTNQTPVPTKTTVNQGTANQGGFKDGVYTGPVTDAFYGNVQVQVTIKSGKISDVQFLQYPNDRGTSVYINSQAMPYLKQEAIQSQNANVNIVSGATQTSRAFRTSLASALAQAH